MSALTGFAGVFVKEVKEIAREKRLFAILVVLSVFAGLPYSFLLRDFARNSGAFGGAFGMILEPFVFITPIALIIVSLTFAADTVSKEKDSGMLGLVLSSPVTTEGFLLAKAAGVLVAYFAVVLWVVLFVGLLAPAFGWVIVEIVLWLFLIPFFALFVFLLGLGLLVSVLMGTSKTAVGVAIAVYFPLILLMQSPPGLGFLLREYSPRLFEILEYNPLGMAFTTAEAILHGAPFDWAPVVVSVALGLGFALGAYLLFRRQEVAG